MQLKTVRQAWQKLLLPILPYVFDAYGDVIKKRLEEMEKKLLKPSQRF